MKKKALLLAVILLLDLLLACFCAAEAGKFMGAARGGAEEKGKLEGEGPDVAADAEGSAAEEKIENGVTAKQEEEKLIALTFDDGPHKVYTKELLDGLRERGVKASFFLVGENIAGNEELVRQMAEDGHLIGTHCYSHEDLTKKTAGDACIDIGTTNEKIQAITGKKPEYIRPPYGSWSEELADCVGMTPVFWDIDTLDWKSQNSSKILAHICKNAGKHQVVLLHDVFETSVEAALAAIDTLKKQGYTFVTVEELLID